LHAVILDISDGTLEQFDQSLNCFIPI